MPNGDVKPAINSQQFQREFFMEGRTHVYGLASVCAVDVPRQSPSLSLFYIRPHKAIKAQISRVRTSSESVRQLEGCVSTPQLFCSNLSTMAPNNWRIVHAAAYPFAFERRFSW